MKTSTRKSCRQKAHRQRAKSLQLIALIGATFAMGALPPRLSPFLKATQAFLPPSETVGPLTVEISGAAPVSQFGKAMALSATLSNSGTSAIRGTLRFLVADAWKISGGAEVPFTLAAGEKKSVPFSVVVGSNSLAAFYPIHARAAFRVVGAPASTREAIAQAVAVVAVTPEAAAAQRVAS